MVEEFACEKGSQACEKGEPWRLEDGEIFPVMEQSGVASSVTPNDDGGRAEMRRGGLGGDPGSFWLHGGIGDEVVGEFCHLIEGNSLDGEGW